MSDLAGFLRSISTETQCPEATASGLRNFMRSSLTAGTF